MSAFGGVLYTSTAAVTCSLGCPSLQTYALALLALGGMKSLKAQSATDENTMVRLTIHKKTRCREGIAGLSAIDEFGSTRLPVWIIVAAQLQSQRVFPVQHSPAIRAAGSSSRTPSTASSARRACRR